MQFKNLEHDNMLLYALSHLFMTYTQLFLDMVMAMQKYRNNCGTSHLDDFDGIQVINMLHCVCSNSWCAPGKFAKYVRGIEKSIENRWRNCAMPASTFFWCENYLHLAHVSAPPDDIGLTPERRADAVTDAPSASVRDASRAERWAVRGRPQLLVQLLALTN